jgi:hypothetical protein
MVVYKGHEHFPFVEDISNRYLMTVRESFLDRTRHTSNHIGVSTLIITDDQKIVIWRQTKADQSRGRLAPTGFRLLRLGGLEGSRGRPKNSQEFGPPRNGAGISRGVAFPSVICGTKGRQNCNASRWLLSMGYAGRKTGIRRRLPCRRPFGGATTKSQGSGYGTVLVSSRLY